MRLPRWPRSGIGICMGLAIALSGCDAGPEALHPSRARGDAVSYGHEDVGGYELDWTCQGSGSPTIVAEAGYDAAGISAFSELLQPLSEISRVCTYDRAGTGSSDARPDGLHVTGLLEAHELHALLEAAAIAPPYVVA